ncbi:uncharacterized protein [Bemisia tabaci]
MGTSDFRIGPQSKDFCDFNLFISSEELQDGSVLTDRTFNHTRGLFMNELWNHKNYIIIAILGSQKEWFHDVRSSIKLEERYPDQNLSDTEMERNTYRYLSFTFQFFWRFFKGQKITICCECTCHWYDPFGKILFRYPDGSGRDFFEGTKQKLIGRYVFDGVGKMTKEIYETFEWEALLHDATDFMLMDTDDFSLFFVDSLGFDIDQKYDINLHVLTPDFSFGILDESLFDHTTAVDTCTVCLATPRSGFIPQYLAPFNCFTHTVWFLVITTVVAILLVQIVFQYSQHTAFRGLYSEQDASAFEATSAALTVYAYFICGSPFRVLLGRFVTGRIIFLVLAFAALIIGTVFTNGMVTLLSERVRYANIDTIDELRRSDILIQSQDMNIQAEFLDEYAEYSELSRKLITSSGYYSALIEEMFIGHKRFAGTYEYYNLTTGYRLTGTEDQAYTNRVQQILKSFTLAAESDAFIFSIPNFLISHQNFWVQPKGALRPVQYHHVKECFLTYPMTFRILKNSIYYDALSRRISQFVESGLVKNLQFLYEGDWRHFSAPEFNQDLPRVFDLRDLQLAFIGLSLGLLVSYFVFVGELLTDLLKH